MTVTNAHDLRRQLADYVLTVPAGAASLGEILEDVLGLGRGATSAHVDNWPVSMRTAFSESMSVNSNTTDATWWAIARYLDGVSR